MQNDKIAASKGIQIYKHCVSYQNHFPQIVTNSLLVFLGTDHNTADRMLFILDFNFLFLSNVFINKSGNPEVRLIHITRFGHNFSVLEVKKTFIPLNYLIALFTHNVPDLGPLCARLTLSP